MATDIRFFSNEKYSQESIGLLLYINKNKRCMEAEVWLSTMITGQGHKHLQTLQYFKVQVGKRRDCACMLGNKMKHSLFCLYIQYYLTYTIWKLLSHITLLWLQLSCSYTGIPTYTENRKKFCTRHCMHKIYLHLPQNKNCTVKCTQSVEKKTRID